MANTHNKLKELCRTLNLDELEALLLEKHQELMKLEYNQRVGTDHRQAYTPQTKGNIEEARRQIAVIKTIINERL